MLSKDQVKAIMEEVIATGNEYTFAYDLTEQKGYEDENELVFSRGIRKTDKVRLCHVFLTHPYGAAPHYHMQGKLYGLDELDEFYAEYVKPALKGWYEDKETIEYNKETQRQAVAFWNGADIREVKMIIDGSIGMPAPKDNFNLRHIVRQAYLDCIGTGEDVVLKLDLGPGHDCYGDWEDGIGSHECDYRFCYNVKTESVDVKILKKEFEDDYGLQIVKGTDRPRTLFVKNAYKLDDFVESFIGHIQTDFE